jgi:glycerol uptake facilitator-like aquaporin
MIPYIAEYLGTFLFLGVIRATSGNPIWSGVALAVGIYLTSALSGGNLNPAVSVMNLALGAMSLNQTLLYIISQVMAGLTVAAVIPKVL